MKEFLSDPLNAMIVTVILWSIVTVAFCYFMDRKDKKKVESYQWMTPPLHFNCRSSIKLDFAESRDYTAVVILRSGEELEFSDLVIIESDGKVRKYQPDIGE